MNQYGQTVRRSSGLDVYTGLLFAALLVLGAGCGLLIKKNMDHSAAASGGQGGGPFKLVSER